MRRGLAVLVLCAVSACTPREPAADALRALASRVEGLQVVDLPAEPARVELWPDQSLTIEHLRGVPLDDHPPVLGQPAKPYDPRMTDGLPPGQAPYVADGIEPFRFRRFHCEFSYGGWHNFAMADYALTHGLDVLFPYNSTPRDWNHVPKGTAWLRWGGFVDWHQWLPKHGIPEGRYDRLADLDVARTLIDEEVFKPNPGYDYLMIDLEHGWLRPDDLRKQPWYPADASQAERRALEQRYYDGYAQTYIAPVEAARRAGWRQISLYGWQPFARTFWGLEQVELDPATDWAWNAFGKAIYEAVDILNPSVYCFYWDPKNVAYTLANIDLNMRLVKSMPQQKPVRPYYWTLLHGGGGGWRWWANQPIRDEDVRAMTALAFFTGIDGLVLWNWSGTGSHHAPSLRHRDPKTKQWVMHDVMVKQGLELTPEGGAAPTAFRRYDALHIQSVSEGGLVRFQRIEKGNAAGNYGITDDKPVYAMPEKELVPHLRAQSEPVAAMVEGLALVKPFEHILRHGEVKIDVPAQKQFAETLPIVRRVKLGRLHILATYDPLWAEQPKRRQIVLEDFDGREGLTLVLPADAQTRLFVLRAP